MMQASAPSLFAERHGPAPPADATPLQLALPPRAVNALRLASVWAFHMNLLRLQPPALVLTLTPLAALYILRLLLRPLRRHGPARRTP
jgi:hypothetical protein